MVQNAEAELPTMLLISLFQDLVLIIILLSGLPVPGTYVVCAYIDFNNNSGPPDPGEPSGEYLGTVSLTVNAPDPTGIDFSLSGQVTAVPTMTEWGMIIFMLFAGLGAFYYLRRQPRA